MPRPLRFRSGLGKILGSVFFFSLGFVLAYTLWFSFVLSPLQKLYLPSYLALPMTTRSASATFPVWWIWKTAPKRKPELAEDADVVSVKASRPKDLPLALSPEAQAGGWTGLVRIKQMGRAQDEAATLQDGFFAGQSLGRLAITPLCGGVALLLFYLGLRGKFGAQSRHEERHGRRTKGPELTSAFAWARGGAGGIRLRMAGKFGLPGAGFRISRRLESSHILLMGDTGSGKSNAIRQILRQVESRGEAAIVYDPAGEFVQEFYNPDRGDLILNPLDARCPFWNLQSELDGRGSEDAIAAAMLPDKQYESGFFTDAPRRVLAALLRKGGSVFALLEWMADPAEIERRLAGTPQAAFLDRKAGPQRAGVLSSMNLIADSLALLPQGAETKEWFNTGDWKYERTKWVFLTSRPALRERILPLHSAWLDLFILRMMEPCVNPAKPVWFVLDELASLNKLPQLHTAVTENRKYGNPVVLGFQGRSQLEKRYGQDAEAMLSQPATKIFFKTSEPRAAKWISETLGEIEVERLKESRSPELIGSRRNYAMEIATKPLVMASEIAGLEPLHGYVKQENRVVPVSFAFVPKRKLQPEFVERKMTVPEPRAVPSVVVQELTPAVIPPPKAIQAQAIEVPFESPVRHVPQIAAAAPDVVSDPRLSLSAETVSSESTQPEPRKSAFKKKEGTAREWKPTD